MISYTHAPHNLWFFGSLFLHGRESLWSPAFKSNSKEEDKEKEDKTCCLDISREEQDNVENEELQKVPLKLFVIENEEPLIRPLKVASLVNIFGV